VDNVDDSLAYYIALNKADVPAEMPLYAQGGHAFGLRRTKFPITGWPQLVERWLGTIEMISEYVSWDRTRQTGLAALAVAVPPRTGGGCSPGLIARLLPSEQTLPGARKLTWDLSMLCCWSILSTIPCQPWM